MKDIYSRPLFVFDMANNHQGNVQHGLRIIREIHEVCKNFDFNFGFKFQYRDLNTFIHPDFKKRDDFRYIKRFSETRLNEEDFLALKNEVVRYGFISVCTPSDEKSVDLIEKHQFDIIKIASVSFTDWSLLERIAKTDKPIIASVAGIALDDIDKVVSFFEHREKDFSLLHCIAEYPTEKSNLQLNQIDFLRERYQKVVIGYSTHEQPDNVDSIKIAIAKGARIFEKHVGIKTDTITLNAYSAIPEQILQWLMSAKEALAMCGISNERYSFTKSELMNLKDLKRGVFAKVPIKSGEKISLANVFLAIPIIDNQISANDMSKYTEFYAAQDIKENQPIIFKNTKKTELRGKIYKIITDVKDILRKSNIIVPNKLDFEISYQYGIDNFEKYGASIINFINRDYCKKIIVLLPSQKHPEQFHKQKEETFNILYGDVNLVLNGVEKKCKAGDWVLVEKGTKHMFSTENGAVIEELSSSYLPEDSFYTDPEIMKNKDRKTYLTYWIN
jgi:sialic acid synthase SpsE